MLSALQIQHHAVPLVVCTAYDAPFARMLEASGVDIILVGDSLANVMLGLASTREVGMAEMELFAGAVLRGATATHVTVDLPYGADANPDLAVAHARRFMDLGASSVKLEGRKVEVVRALVAAGIPVMGHIGVMPQTAESFRRVGLTVEDRVRLIGEAEELQDAGVFSMVLENVQAETARDITHALAVPTIGIGSGSGTRGQVQVLHDLLGLLEKSPPFARPFAALRTDVQVAVAEYARAVRGGSFGA
jgi:3-methyl-2-oxobutanoate hydroxymethyltransferase